MTIGYSLPVLFIYHPNVSLSYRYVLVSSSYLEIYACIGLRVSIMFHLSIRLYTQIPASLIIPQKEIIKNMSTVCN